MPESFHFLQPWWLLALLPLMGLLWLLAHGGSAANPWRGVVEPRLLQRLLVGGSGQRHWLPLVLLGIGGMVAVLALAGPVWEKKPLPVFKRQQALVIVLDLSQSMLTPDLPPSRMARARYKVRSLLQQRHEGQTGLVVFAGDAFVVTPLTDDIRTIDAQLRPLSPELMPVQGSRVDRGLEEAERLLQQAGMPRGDILLITDGFRDPQALEVARRLQKEGFRLSVLGVGTPEGAPLPDGHGGFVHHSSGKVVMPKLDEQLLRSLAEAGGGDYATISVGGGDLQRLLGDTGVRVEGEMQKFREATGQWLERGPWLLPLLLPLAAVAFRRGWLLSLALAACMLPLPNGAYAFGWSDLWKRPDQRAIEALHQGRPEEAERLASDPLTKGSALYRAGKYRQALQAFSSGEGADAAYNRGNALARLGEYKEAIAAYEEALKKRPDMQDARYNKALVEKLLREQEKKQRQQEKQSQEGAQKQERQGQQQKSGQQKQGRKQNQDQQREEGQQQEKAEGENEDKNKQPRATTGEAEKEGAGESNVFDQALKDLNNEKEEEGVQQEQPRESPQGMPDEKKPVTQEKVEAESLDSEERAAAEQWLRRIPDDPGGLLRRKFLYQYQQRNSAVGGDEPPW